MGEKITKLTPDQESRLDEFREQWLRVGLCCEPADFETGDRIIHGFYARLGKSAPVILHFSSPAMCELAANFLFSSLKRKPCPLHELKRVIRLHGQLQRQITDELGEHLCSRLVSQFPIQLESQLRHLDFELERKLSKVIYGPLDDKFFSGLRRALVRQLDGLHRGLGRRLCTQTSRLVYRKFPMELPLHGRLEEEIYRGLHFDGLASFFVYNRWGGQHWCAWEAFYLFGCEIGVDYKANDLVLLREWAKLAQSIGWWAAWDGICLVSDRPRVVKFDADGRLHNEAGMAVEYPDGWGISAWHGTRVPHAWIADPSTLTPVEALTWHNIEERRAACQMLGWNRILLEFNTKTIDKDDDPEIGELIEVELPGMGRERFLRVVCGTKRLFALPVPPNMQTALQAQAWTWDLTEATFDKPEIRT